MKNITTFINESIINEALGLKRGKQTEKVDLDMFHKGSNGFQALQINVSKRLAKYSSKDLPREARGLSFAINSDGLKLNIYYIKSDGYPMKRNWNINAWYLESKNDDDAKEEIVNVVNHILSNEKAWNEFMKWNIEFRNNIDASDYGSTSLNRLTKYIDKNGDTKFKYDSFEAMSRGANYADHYVKWLGTVQRPLSSLLNIK